MFEGRAFDTEPPVSLTDGSGPIMVHRQNPVVCVFQTGFLFSRSCQICSVKHTFMESVVDKIVVVVVEMNIIKVALSHCCCKTTVQY